MQNEDYRRRNFDPRLADLFFRLGYDINDPDELRRLSDDLRWISERREASETGWALRRKTAWTIVAAALGPPITLAVQWLVTRYNGGGHP